jgi:predicted permease
MRGKQVTVSGTGVADMRADMSDFLGDLRYAFRSLRRSPTFTAVAVVSMTLGIAANTAVFTLVDQVVLRRLPVRDAAALVQVDAQGTETYAGGLGDGTELSYAMYRELRDGNTVFDGLFCRFQTTLQVTTGGRGDLVAGELVSGTFFPTLGVRPAVGRLLDPGDERAPGGQAVAVLGYRYWRARFGADPTVVGRQVTVNGQPLEVVGVVEETFEGLDFGQPVQIYAPITMQPRLGPAWLRLENPRFRWVQVYGRLPTGLSREAAQARIQPLYRSILEREATDAAFAAASPDTRQKFLDGRLNVEDASRGHSTLRDSVTQPLLILMAIAAGVLLIVCANVANLLIARGVARYRELVLRVAVGATRSRLVRLLLVESLLLAGLGAGLGLVLSGWGAGLLLGFFVTPENPLAISADPDGRIILFTTAMGLLTAVVAGTIPALRGTRVDLAHALKGAGGAVLSAEPRLRKALVVAQVAVSFLLLVAAGLFVRTLDNLLRLDPGFQTERTVSVSMDLARSGYDSARAHAFTTALLERLGRMPEVSSAAYAFVPLLTGGGWGMGFTVEGYQPAPGRRAGSMANSVSPGFFETLGAPILAGREFTDRDDRAPTVSDGWPYRVAVVNETFAQQYVNGASPIGRHVGIGTDPGTAMPIEIVGLVRDFRYTGIREEARPQIFFPYRQANDVENVTVYARTTGDAGVALQSVRRAVAALDPELPLFDAMTLDERVKRSVVNERLIASLSGALSALATLLAVIGLYGVMAYAVSRRTREIGIRMALGALGSQVARGVLAEAGVLVGAGLAVGLSVAWWLARYVQSQLYEVTPADPAALVVATLALAVAAAAATLMPARRAARVSPTSALRDG